MKNCQDQYQISTLLIKPLKIIIEAYFWFFSATTAMVAIPVLKKYKSLHKGSGEYLLVERLKTKSSRTLKNMTPGPDSGFLKQQLELDGPMCSTTCRCCGYSSNPKGSTQLVN